MWRVWPAPIAAADLAELNTAITSAVAHSQFKPVYAASVDGVPALDALPAGPARALEISRLKARLERRIQRRLRIFEDQLNLTRMLEGNRLHDRLPPAFQALVHRRGTLGEVVKHGIRQSAALVSQRRLEPAYQWFPGQAEPLQLLLPVCLDTKADFEAGTWEAHIALPLIFCHEDLQHPKQRNYFFPAAMLSLAMARHNARIVSSYLPQWLEQVPEWPTVPVAGPQTGHGTVAELVMAAPVTTPKKTPWRKGRYEFVDDEDFWSTPIPSDGLSDSESSEDSFADEDELGTATLVKDSVALLSPRSAAVRFFGSDENTATGDGDDGDDENDDDDSDGLENFVAFFHKSQEVRKALQPTPPRARAQRSYGVVLRARNT
jgi:hypothetical protein